MARRENWLTWGLLAACLAVAGASILPRFAAPPRELRTVRNDITVSIAGAVNAPGIYTLPWGARVAELVELAGGLSAEADPALVALAAPLSNGQALYVPRRLTDTGGARISLNYASAEELQRLPGVGPAIAQRIIEGRPYSSIDDLLRVRGIGEQTLERLRALVTL